MFKRSCLIASFFILILFLAGCTRPVVMEEATGTIDVSKGPLQIDYKKGGVIFRKEVRRGWYAVFPVARYKISGVCVSKRFYNDEWLGQVAPVDLAIVWGSLAHPEADKHIKYIQQVRWCNYEYSPTAPFNPEYIKSHMSNNHIIPANKNVLAAIKTLGKRDKIEIEGYLVNVQGVREGQDFRMTTSTVRGDSKANACEIIYVTKIRIGDKIYY